MATIVTRSGKGSPLTSAELDQNQINLNTDKAELSGATFTGVVTANAGVVVDNFTLDGTTLALSSGDMVLHTTGNDFDIIFNGSDGGVAITALRLDMSSLGAATFNAGITATSLDISGDIDIDGTTNLDVVDIDGPVNAAAAVTINGVLTANAGAIFNEGSGDLDFRIESNGNANMLFVDGGNDAVGIGNSAPASMESTANDLVIGAGSTNTGMTIFSGTSSAGRIFFADGTSGGALYDGFIKYDHSNQSLAFGTGATGATDFNIASDGKVKIASAATTTPQLTIGGTDGGGSRGIELLDDNAGKYNFLIAAQEHINNGFEITPSTAAGGTTYTNPALVIESSGNVVLNENGIDADFRVESSGNTHAIYVDGASNVVNFGRGSSNINSNGGYILGGECIMSTGSTAATYLVRNTSSASYSFYVSGAGQIHAVQTSISSLSDERLKENIVDIDTGLAEVMALKPRKFDWREGEGSNEKNVTGFVAQEVETVLPDLISSFKHDDLDDAKSVKMGDMVPTLVKAIQEQQTLIKTLTARITALENA